MKILGYKLDKLNNNGHMIVDIHMPAEILSVANLHNEIFIYALVDDNDDGQTTPIDILVIGTGKIINTDMNTYKFVGTVSLDNGAYVLHIFYRQIDILGGDSYIISETNKAHINDLYEKHGRGEIIMA